jgi:hypothetical protein
MRWSRMLGMLVVWLGVAVAPPVSAAGAAELAWTELAVRVYDSSGGPATATRTALGVAARVLGPASVDVTWVLCPSPGAGRCERPLARNEVIVRLVRAPVPVQVSRDAPLGTALVDPVTGSGVLATIFLDRVEALAQAARADPATLLGRAIAHEIGHLLLGHTAHAVRGLMRPRWTRAEVERNLSADWGFARPEVQALAARADATRR